MIAVCPLCVPESLIEAICRSDSHFAVNSRAHHSSREGLMSFFDRFLYARATLARSAAAVIASLDGAENRSHGLKD